MKWLVSWCSEGGRSRVDLPAAGVWAIPQAPGGRSAHCLHKAEASWHHASCLQRGTGAYSTRSRRHPTRSQPLQAHLSPRVRHTLRRLHQLQVRARPISMHCIICGHLFMSYNRHDKLAMIFLRVHCLYTSTLLWRTHALASLNLWRVATLTAKIYV